MLSNDKYYTWIFSAPVDNSLLPEYILDIRESTGILYLLSAGFLRPLYSYFLLAADLCLLEVYCQVQVTGHSPIQAWYRTDLRQRSSTNNHKGPDLPSYLALPNSVESPAWSSMLT